MLTKEELDKIMTDVESDDYSFPVEITEVLPGDGNGVEVEKEVEVIKIDDLREILQKHLAPESEEWGEWAVGNYLEIVPERKSGTRVQAEIVIGKTDKNSYTTCQRYRIKQ